MKGITGFRQFIHRNAANMITILNLLLGVSAILLILDGNIKLAVHLIIVAMVADSMDGKVSKKLGISNDFGRELDSLCDMVSFGIAPAVIIYQVYLSDFGFIGMLVGGCFCVCGALRLAKYNTSEAKPYFTGLPITIAGGLVTLIAPYSLFISPVWSVVIFVSAAYLMVSPIRFYRKILPGSHHFLPVVFAVIGVAGVVFLGELMLLILLSTYIFHGLALMVWNRVFIKPPVVESETGMPL